MFWKEHPDTVTSWYALRELPYLTACINEGLRLGAGSMKRSPRIFPDDDIQYKDWVIPRGVSGTSLLGNIPAPTGLTIDVPYLDSSLHDNLLHAHGPSRLPGSRCFRSRAVAGC